MMQIRRRLNGVPAKATVALAISAMAASAGTAQAAFPDFTGCARSTPNLNGCVNVQSRSGYLDIKGFRVPIGESFQIRGAIATPGGPGGEQVFIPAAGTSGVISKPIQVPGGLLGIDFPIPGNAVTATAELAGPASTVRFDIGTMSLALPLKMRLSNPLIGPNCHIGSNSSPVRLNLITGTTSPPAPNRPITGRFGSVTFDPSGVLFIRGNTNVDNAFSVPGASSCGLGLGLIDQIVNAKLKIPSAAGNNAMQVVNDVALG